MTPPNGRKRPALRRTEPSPASGAPLPSFVAPGPSQAAAVAERQPPVLGRVRPPAPEALRFVLPLPPSANDYWVIGWHRRKPCLILSDEARAYKTAIALKGRVERRVPLEGSVELRLVVHFADRRSDLSNRIKVLEDALQGVAYANDKQVNRLVAERGSEAFPPRVEVEVRPWTSAE